MNKPVWLLGAALVLLAGCDDFNTAGSANSDQFITELPESLLNMAAPHQDLKAVKLDPATGCFIYRHVGPVETTFLPLVSRQGRPICTARPETPAGETT